MNFDDFAAEIEARYPEPVELTIELDPPHYLALNVINLRSDRGMTQAQLAEMIGISQPRIARIERGEANPRLITLSKLAHALDVSLSELLVDNLCEPARTRRAALWKARQENGPSANRQAQ
jgi:transcriptional regulator with XRE-family HTH domain